VQAELVDVGNYNFDHPDAFDTPCLLDCIAQLKAGQAVEVPVYDFTTHTRAKETRKVGVGGWRGSGVSYIFITKQLTISLRHLLILTFE
jgi:hypothetical protein